MSSTSKPALTVRDATLADLATINDIHVQSRQRAYRGLVSVGRSNAALAGEPIVALVYAVDLT